MNKPLILAKLSMICGIGLVALGVTQAEPVFGPLGLIHGLPYTLLVGMGFLALASALLWRQTESHGWLLLLIVILLVFALEGIAPLVEGTARNRASYNHIGESLSIIATHRIDPLWLADHNWPGFNLLWAQIFEVTGLEQYSDVQPFHRWMPVLGSILLVIPLFICLRPGLDQSSSNWWQAGVWFFFASNWLGVQEGGGQSTGLFLLIFIAAVLIMMSSRTAASNSVSWRIVLLISYTGLVATHFLSSFVALAAFLFLVLLSPVLRSRARVPSAVLGEQRNRLPIITFSMFMLLVVLLATWQVYAAESMLSKGAHTLGTTFANLGFLVKRNVTERMTGAPGREQAIAVRVVFSSAVVVIGSIGAFRKFRRQNWHFGAGDIVMLSLLAGSMSLILLPFYEWELFHRLYLYSLVPLCYFAIELLRARIFTLVLPAILVVSIIPFYIAHYGNEAVDYVSPSEVAGFEFFQSHSIPGRVVGGGPIGTLPFREGYELVHSDGLWTLLGTEEYLVAVGKERSAGIGSATYIALSRGDASLYELVAGDPQFLDRVRISLDEMPQQQRFYDSGDLELYVEQR